MDLLNANIVMKTHDNGIVKPAENEDMTSKVKQRKHLKQKVKVSDDEFKILKPHEYNQINTTRYKVCHLKEMCRFYELKKSGNKDELKTRMFDFLRFSLYITVIQRNWRGYLVREYVKGSGPAMKDRTICVNDTDFATLEPLIEICYNQFYSFTENNNCYGCDIYSLYNLIHKRNDGYNPNTPIEVRNPYDREIITTAQITAFNRYLRFAKALEIPFKINDEQADLIDRSNAI